MINNNSLNQRVGTTLNHGRHHSVAERAMKVIWGKETDLYKEIRKLIKNEKLP
jgi:hypothetical protein